MNMLNNLLLLILALVLGLTICLLLNMKSYIKIAIIVIILLISFITISETVLKNKGNSLPVPNSQPLGTNTIGNTQGMVLTGTSSASPANGIPDYYLRKNDANMRFAREKDLEESKYGLFKHKTATGEDRDASPFDGLDPKELNARMAYLYYATSQPYKNISYTDFKMHADKLLDISPGKLGVNDPKLLGYSAGFYPQLTADQIDAKDCLNYGSGPKSCFQSAQLFYNVKNKFGGNNGVNGINGVGNGGVLAKGVNEANANLIIHEDFSNPQKLDVASRYKDVMFVNAPLGNLDYPLDQTSNEYLKLNDPALSTCRNCKMAVCTDDYCGLQNQLCM